MAKIPLEAADKRSRILEAAYEVCARRGVDAARMEEVAARAQVSKGTLYHYFESKEHLLLATLIDSYERNVEGAEASFAAEGDPREQLAGSVDLLVRVLAEVGPRMRVHYQAWGIVARNPALGEQLYGFLRAFHGRHDAELCVRLHEGQRQGSVRPDVDVEAVAVAMQGLLAGFLYRATFDPERATPALLRRGLDMLLRDVLTEAAPSGGPRRG